MIGDIINNYRKKKGWTYWDLAKNSGVSKTYLSLIIFRNRVPSNRIIKKVAVALGFDPNEIKEYSIREEYSSDFNFNRDVFLDLGGLTEKQRSVVRAVAREFRRKESK
jgi:transcriptional regulator with XRE-family HTH domain